MSFPRVFLLATALLLTGSVLATSAWADDLAGRHAGDGVVTPAVVGPDVADAGPLARRWAAATFVGEVVVREVVGRHGTMGRARTPAIWSDIRCEVVSADKDEVDASRSGVLELTSLGGRVGDTEHRLSVAPRFQVGDRLYLFAAPGRLPYPTVDGRAGVWRVVEGQLHTHGGQPIVELSTDGPVVAPPEVPSAAVAVPRTPGAAARPLPHAGQPALSLVEARRALKAEVSAARGTR